MSNVNEFDSVSLSGCKSPTFLTVVGGYVAIVNRILTDTLRCSSLLISNCGLLLKIASLYCQNNVSSS